MMNPSIGYANETLAGWPWAADNGCFSDRWDADVWRSYLDRRPPTAVFAVVPDVVGDAAATLDMWHQWSAVVRNTGHRPVYVLQDGEDGSTVPDDAFGVFVGGSTEYKMSYTAARIVADIKRQGRYAHMGRVNSYRRIRVARDWGCDSADGTCLAFGPDVNTPRLLSWLDQLNGCRQLVLGFE